MLQPVSRVKEINDTNQRANLQLNCALSAGLWAILQEHSRKTNEPVSHIVSRALAEYFQVSHSTLYQVSTATALVEGIYQGAVRVRTLLEHGDLGLGTFENLDGEMMIVDEQFLSQDHQSGGHLLECAGSELRLQIQREGDYHVALPETEDFVKADLRRDPAADLAKAEGAKK
jgi:Alpha-acetolactate decarboxylase